MGYRHYIYEVDAELVEKIRACKTNEEYCEVCKANITNHLFDDEEGFFPVYWLGKELFEFGKYYENASEMYKHGESLFATEELRENYEDYEAIVLEKSGLMCAIEWQQNRIISIYEDLLREESEDKYDSRTQLERLKADAADSLRWWKFGACNLSKNSDHVASSWLYEHTIFDLVRIYKTFDWDNKRMLFCGW